MSRLVDCFVHLAAFWRLKMLSEPVGLKVVFEVDGEMETARFAAAIGQDFDLTRYSYPVIENGLLRCGQVMGIPFEVRKSPRCPTCHK